MGFEPTKKDFWRSQLSIYTILDFTWKLWIRYWSLTLFFCLMDDPFLSTGWVHFISNFRCVWWTFSFLFYFWKKFVLANSVDPDQTLRSGASDQGLQCLPVSLLKDARHKWGNTDDRLIRIIQTDTRICQVGSSSRFRTCRNGFEGPSLPSTLFCWKAWTRYLILDR